MIRALLLSLLLAGPAFAVQPDEILSDPALEARARAISQGLRCPVCRNENIDDSNAGIARDLRLLVRERLVAGDTDQEALDFIVGRYGEYVLLSPPAKGTTLILWAAGPLLLLAGGGMAVAFLRRRRPAVEELTEEERARLDTLLKD
ncbi:cytochrome c-type biogenesis protein [Falsirhodobacter sp. 20TX0035]|uniref:cytochrome c-type biogenesis protein n=1 Tax=Falsirhodobacter sp. 20TX0035 TaxID=3022019 RepID=UPI00232BCA38|nr:cytochrome c-type biogenesis protein [Falsirhodobacter sp. 20TX0035]MDB6453174.1 cytochrome c-type biogenesis protein CcmH [Falsirhodobacter sp. 20TX0035]